MPGTTHKSNRVQYAEMLRKSWFILAISLFIKHVIYRLFAIGNCRMNMPAIKNNLILRLSIEFSIEVIEYTQRLNEQRHYVIAKQLLRSATSIGANTMEAQQGESNADFVHKMKIAAKEAVETQYWLILCSEADSYPSVGDLLDRLGSISRILNRIIATAKSNL